MTTYRCPAVTVVVVLALVVLLMPAAPLISSGPVPGVAGAQGAPGPVPGAFAFHYASSYTDEELAWFGRFRLVVPGSALPAWQVDLLRSAGTGLFLYEWATGIYITDPQQVDPGSWKGEVWANRERWLLNPDGPAEGPDGRWRAYYYDPYHRDFQRAWVGDMDGRRKSAGYQGIFFDLVGSGAVPADLRQVYESRHPAKPYDRALADVFAAVRKKGMLVFTNQGYRRAEHYLKVADYDLTESLMTSYAWGFPVTVYVEGAGLVGRRETYYRPWSSLRTIGDDIQVKVARYNPAVKVLHLNYANAAYEPTGATATVNGASYPVFREVTDRAAIYYGYVAAKLWGQESYSYGRPLRLGQDEVYFADLGLPLGSGYEERDGVVLRYYERGVVVLNPSTEVRSVSLASPLVPAGVAGVHDLYAGDLLPGLTVTIAPTRSEASGQVYPSGRVYLYAR